MKEEIKEDIEGWEGRNITTGSSTLIMAFKYNGWYIAWIE